jgi:mannose-6-phosphate isomerase-like protein (cupin superfamily)
MGNSEVPEEIPFGQKKEKPWGYERPLAKFQGIFLKELFLQKGCSSSLHFHKEKDEFFYIVSGRVRIHIADNQTELAAGDTLHIAPGQPHRIEPLQDTLILEMGTRMFGDVTRIANDYNRPSHE